MEKSKRYLSIILEKEASSTLFSLEAAKALREYADMVESWVAGRNSCETYTSADGVKLTAIGARWSGEELPLEKPPY